MVAKAVLLVCASALLVKTISGQCIGASGLPGPGFIPDAFSMSGPGLGFGPSGNYAGLNGMAPTNLGASFGGGLAVTSSSPIAPTGLTVTSENAIEGALTVVGSLPFLGTVSVEGAYQTAGAGAVSYGCGNGAIGITAENGPMAPAGIAPAPYAPSGIAPPPFAPAGVAPGYGAMPGYGWGAAPCGPIY